MVETADINVQINKSDKSVLESSVKIEKNSLSSLISNLKTIQKKVNDVLTELVQNDQSSSQGKNVHNYCFKVFLFVFKL